MKSLHLYISNTILIICILARPEILSITQGSCEDPERIVVDSNMDITVRCEVFGIPTPTVMLLTPIPTMVDITMMGGSVVATLLLRGNGLLPREGDYTCVGSNSLGTVNQTITIVIRSELFKSFCNVLLGITLSK